ncbi:hypothetical protein ABGB18_25325 [Nonomuraea sp. B12E4]|uniref:hypothetical protein n=1 Tax=Nonomuraea sp. B12E4 TaxID=3153564 RepID=UPI00325CD51E
MPTERPSLRAISRPVRPRGGRLGLGGVQPQAEPLEHARPRFRRPRRAAGQAGRTFELSAAEITRVNGIVDSTYPDAVRETDATRKYNCHAFAWYSTSPFGNVWMNDPGDNTYWLDGIVSKWGQWARVRHAWHDSPYNDSVIYRYWRNW